MIRIYRSFKIKLEKEKDDQGQIIIHWSIKSPEGWPSFNTGFGATYNCTLDNALEQEKNKIDWIIKRIQTLYFA